MIIKNDKRIIDIPDALRVLVPSAIWRVENDPTVYENLIWESADIPQPSKAAIDAEITKQQAEWDSKEYARNRAPEYPSIGDQLDMLWKAIDSGKLDKTSDFYTKLAAVKTKYPK